MTQLSQAPAVTLPEQSGELLPPYTSAETPCVKCAHLEAFTKYQPAAPRSMWDFNGRTAPRGPLPERLERTCQNCGHQWDEALVPSPAPLAVAQGALIVSPRQPAYDAVYAYLRELIVPPGEDIAQRNALIWHAVERALDAIEARTPGQREARQLAETAKALQHVLSRFRAELAQAQRHRENTDPSERTDCMICGSDHFAFLAGILNTTPRLLPCGHCYEEDGKEIHPHPECTMASPAGAGTRQADVNDLARALDNATPYPLELTGDVGVFIAHRLLEMLHVQRQPGHPVWQADEELPPVQQPTTGTDAPPAGGVTA